VTLVGESFGGCLALRVAAAAPQLVARLVLVNPATCFGQSLFGVSSLIAATGLLSIFPKPLYEVQPCAEMCMQML
jgi:pimeloyl-ACP methyl ester carboxylesterase